MNPRFSFLLKVISILFILLNGQQLLAQKNENRLNFFTNDVVDIDDNKVFSVLMKLENTSQDTIKAHLKTQIPSTIKSLSQEDLQIIILPNKKAFIPLKFVLNKTQVAGDVNMNFKIIDDQLGLELAASKTVVKIASKRSIKIFPVQSNLLYSQEGDSVHYDVKVINGGNQLENVLITSSYPDYKGVIVTESKKVKVGAFQEVNVRFSKYISQDMMKIESLTTNVAAYNDEGKFSGNIFYTIYNANSNRKYVDPNYNLYFKSDYNSNFIRLNYRDVGTYNQNFNLTSHHEFAVGENEFAYNINSTTWAHINQPTLTDTWVAYQRKGRGVRVGTINNNELDIPINGRGVMFYQNINESDNKIVLGAAESNYNLLEDFELNDLKKNSKFFGYSKFLVKENELETSALFERNNNINNVILTGAYKWLTPNKWSHQVKFGYGISNISHTNITENSFSASANIAGEIGKYSFYSTNYFSSGYYPGTRRGALFLNQRLQRGFKKFSTWASFTLTNNNPKPFELVLDNYTRSNDSRALRGDFGVTFKLNKRVNFTLSPKINIEKSYVIDFNDFIYKPVDFKSSYFNGSVSWLSNSRNHQLIFNSYAGFYKLNNLTQSKPVIFGQFLWNYKQLQINTSFQKGSLMIGEVFSAYNYSNDINRFNLSFSYRESFFNDRLSTNLTGYFNHDINFGNTLTVGATLDYKVIDNLHVNSNVNLSQYNTKSFTNNQSYIQLAVQYNLPAKQMTNGQKQGNLHVFVYYDYNANGIFDEGDKVSDNRMVKINEANFLTSANGEIFYKKVPYGEYQISVPGQKWYAQDYTVYINSKTTSVGIPMQLTGIVRGKVQLQSNSKLEYRVSTNLLGLTIVFVHENGQKVVVKTNDRGEYSSYLPIGNYTFYILESSLPEHVFAKVFTHKITIEQEKNIEYEPMILNVKEMKVNIKRFGS